MEFGYNLKANESENKAPASGSVTAHLWAYLWNQSIDEQANAETVHNQSQLNSFKGLCCPSKMNATSYDSITLLWAYSYREVENVDDASSEMK